MSGLPTIKSLDELTELVERRPGLYLRYSKGPDADEGKPSVDYESGQKAFDAGRDSTG